MISIIDQIIRLKEKYGILEDDSTYEKQVEWLSWAIKNGHCEVITTLFGRVRGFLEWVRLNEFPTSAKDFKLDHSVMRTAPIAFVGNAYAENISILRKLKNMALKKQSDAKYICWHSKRRNRIFITRRNYALSP